MASTRTEVVPKAGVSARVRRFGGVRAWNIAVLVLPVLLTAWLAWDRRWITDDGLIVTRTVRELLAGNGPNFNPGERVEADTSPLWTYIVAAAAWATHVDPARLAVYLGGLFATAGVAFAADGTRRLRVPRLDAAPLLPAGVCVLLALPPFWDFATSGLETGLDFCWMGLCWWLLVRVRRRARRALVAAAAVVIGLGPLVRPEQAMTSVVLLVALWLLCRPSWRRGAGWLAVALVLPVGYEIFRMGYYGLLVPNTALAKDAAGIDAGRGWHYLMDTVQPYLLWIPGALLAAAAAVALRRRRTARRDVTVAASRRPPVPRPTPGVVLAGAAVGAGVLQLAYVVAIGGDFMHGRMVLPGLFLLLLPVLILPAGRAETGIALGLAAWALVCGFGLRVNEHGGASPYISASGIADERAYYTHWTHTSHPVTARPYVRADAALRAAIAKAATSREPVLVIQGDRRGVDEDVSVAGGDDGAHLVLVWDFLGTEGAALPLDDVAADDFGLAYPLASHMQLVSRGRAGHEKQLPAVWVVADYRSPSVTSPDPAYRARIAAARRALGCGGLAELQAAVRDPLTPGRFWSNLTGSFARTALRFPADPVAAEREFCGA